MGLKIDITAAAKKPTITIFDQQKDKIVKLIIPSNLQVGLSHPDFENGITIYGGTFLPLTKALPASTTYLLYNNNGALYWNGSALGGAPADASYLTLGTDGGLSAERVLTAGTNISFADGGAGGTLTISAAGGGNDVGWVGASAVIYTTGSLGVGTSGPDRKLDVLDASNPQLRLTHTDGSKFVDLKVDTNHDLTVTPSSTGQIKLQPTTDSTDFFQVLDADGGTPILNVDSTNERVGIGQSTPPKTLTLEFDSSDADAQTGNGLSGGGAGYGLLIENTNSTANTYANLDFRSNNADGRIALVYTDSNDGDFYFITDNDNSIQTSMVITSAGNVGIGTTTPISAFEIESGLTTVGAVLTLGTKEPTVVANDVLGRINFYAPLDTGTDSDEIGASIAAIAQDTFSDSVNSTALVFQTGKSEVATTKMVIDEDGNIGIGTTAPAHMLEVHTDTGFGAEIGIVQINNTAANDGANLRIKRARGTQAIPTIVSSGDLLGGIHWYGFDGVDYASEAAAIFAEVDGTPGENDMPGRLRFFTTPDGSETRAERLRIESDGGIFWDSLVETGGEGTAYLRFNTTNDEMSWLASTRKFKKDIIDHSLGLDIIEKLNPVEFTYRSAPDMRTLGFIAEEVATVHPLLASYGPDFEIDEGGNIVKEWVDVDGEKGERKQVKKLLSEDSVPIVWDDQAVVSVLVNAVKELKERVEALESALKQATS